MRPLVVLAMLAGTASAQATRYPRQPAVPRPHAPQLVQPIQPAPSRPSLGIDDVLSIASVRGHVRPEQEQILKELIANTPDSEVDEKSDYYFRLAELYAMLHRDARARSADAQAKDYLVKAVHAFKLLTDNDAFKGYPKLDFVLFDYGYMLAAGRYMTDARAVFDKLLRTFPNSKYVPQADLVLADYYDSANQGADAEAFYRKVLEFPRSSVVAYARYRLGWLLLAAKRDRDAIEMFATVTRMPTGDPTQRAVITAAQQDLARTAAAFVRPDTAYAMFEQIDKDSVLDLLDMLGTAYRDRGRLGDALATYREVTKHAPSSCGAQVKVAELVVATTPQTAAPEVDKLLRLAATDPAPLVECHAPAVAMARDLAFTAHAAWAATRNPDELTRAEAMYTAYTTASPDDHGDVAYYFAELLWSRADFETDAKQRPARWQRAAEAFRAAESTDPQRRHDIAQGAFLAWKNALDFDDRPEVAAGPIDLVAASRAKQPAREIAARDQHIIDACEAMAQVAAPGEVAPAKLVEALMYRRNNHASEAIAVLTDLVAHFRSDATAEVSANLLLEQLVRMHQFDDALALVDQLAADPAFIANKPALQRNIDLLRSRSLR
jgi:TolA-binding protein